MTRSILAVCATLLLSATHADEERNLVDLVAGWGTDLNDIQLRSEALAPGLSVIRGAGGAAIASIGDDGALLVDDQFAQGVPHLQRELATLGADGLDYVINTHWHFDHADGNPALGAAGARIIAHIESRNKMMVENKVAYVGQYYMQPPYPEDGLPEITFDDSMSLHFNGQRIDVRYFGPAHTAGDAVVYFRGDNVVHVGDLYSNRYPYIDAGNGGSLRGLIAVCEDLLNWTDSDTLIVSGHSPDATRDNLRAYLDMLQSVERDLSELAGADVTLEDVLAAGITEQYDGTRGNPTLFLTMAYRSMASD